MAQGYPPPVQNQPPYPPQNWQPDWTEEDANPYAPPEGGTDGQPRRRRGLFGRGRAD